MSSNFNDTDLRSKKLDIELDNLDKRKRYQDSIGAIKSKYGSDIADGYVDDVRIEDHIVLINKLKSIDLVKELYVSNKHKVTAEFTYDKGTIHFTIELYKKIDGEWLYIWDSGVPYNIPERRYDLRKILESRVFNTIDTYYYMQDFNHPVSGVLLKDNIYTINNINWSNTAISMINNIFEYIDNISHYIEQDIKTLIEMIVNKED